MTQYGDWAQCVDCRLRVLTMVSKRVIDSVLAQQHNIHHIKPSQLIVAFHIETNHLFCTANQVTGFYMKSTLG